MLACSFLANAPACWNGWRRSLTRVTGGDGGIPWPACSAVSAAAVLAGARSVTAIAEWAADAPWPVLAALGGAP